MDEFPKMLFKRDDDEYVIVRDKAEETLARADGYHDYGQAPKVKRKAND